MNLPETRDTHHPSVEPRQSGLVRGLNGIENWLETRTGAVSAARAIGNRVLPGGASWCRVWPSAILFLLMVQALTGAILWMHYSPSAQTAWESVFYIQYKLPGGWLVRGIHHYSAQFLVAVAALYLLHLVFSGAYRPPRELVWWTALLMLALALGGCLTGDLLGWDINGYSASQVRVGFLTLIPGFGGDLYRLVAGGPNFGHHTLTRFFALHVGVIAGGFFLVFLIHHYSLRRAEKLAGVVPLPQCPFCARLRVLWKGVGKASQTAQSPGCVAGVYQDEAYWPWQFVRNAVVWVGLMALIILFVLHPWKKPEGGVGGHWGDYGARLLSPADPDPAAFYQASRPEWSFRGLYQLANMFPGGSMLGLPVSWKIVPIFVLPGLVGLVLLAMPFIALWRFGHAVNVAVVMVITGGLVVLSLVSYRHDALDEHYQQAVREALEKASRTKALILCHEGIPAEGALALLKSDPKTRGPELYAAHCVICHDLPAVEPKPIRADKPSAPKLSGFAGRAWLEGLFDPKRIVSEEYFGQTRFAASAMVRYVEGRWLKLSEEDRRAVIEALVAEGRHSESHLADVDISLVSRGSELIAEHCTQCHQYQKQGPIGFTPSLDGYGSYAWLVGVIADPTHGLFYGPRNDRMPVFWKSAEDVGANRLQGEEVALLAKFLLQEWAELGKQPPRREPFLFVAGMWHGVRPTLPADVTLERGRWLYERELCSLCHSVTGVPGEAEIVAFKPAGADLGKYGTREWIAGWFDRVLVASPRYFGATAFANGSMVKFVRTSLPELIQDIGQEEFDRVLDFLAEEASREGPLPKDQVDQEILELFEDFTCTDCHLFYGNGGGTGPDLTGYGSHQWSKQIIADPTHARFYGSRNDGMPSYRAFPNDPGKNLLSEEELDELVRWLRRSVGKGPASSR